MDRFELRMQLLRHRIETLEVRSPLTGVVVSGDLEKAEGAPLKTGQTLFEIAPLDHLIAEIAIPQDEISSVNTGQPVTLRLDAYPQRVWQADIQQIHPRAEIRDETTVFVAEVSLDNRDRVLRPGMKGRARVAGPSRPWAWNLFHKPWYKLVQFLGL